MKSVIEFVNVHVVPSSREILINDPIDSNLGSELTISVCSVYLIQHDLTRSSATGHA